MTRPLAALLCAVCLVAAAQTPAFAQDAREIQDLMAAMAKDDYGGQKAHDRLVEIGAPASDALLTGLSSDTPRVRYWSAAALARIGDERAYDRLKNLARDDPNEVVRSTALWHLQLYGRDQVYPLAAELLGDPHRMVRGWAMRVLRENNRPEALPRLRELSKSDDPFTRADAVHAIVTLMGDGQIAFLKGIVADDPSSDVRLQALRCLTIVPHDPAVLDVMIDALDDADEEVRREAVTLLRKGADQVFGYIPTDDPDARRAAAAQWRQWYNTNRERLAWNDERRRFEAKDL